MFINKYTKYINILLVFILLIISYKLINNYQYFASLLSDFLSIISPFIYALAFAYILNPVVNFFEIKLSIKRNISILLTYLIIISFILIGIIFTVPSIINSIINVTKEIPNYVEILQGKIDLFTTNTNTSELLNNSDLLSNFQNISIRIGNISISILQNSASYLLSFTSNVVKIILGLLISIYVLNDKKSFLNNCKILVYMIFKEKNGSRILSLVKTYNIMIGNYIGIKAIDSFIIGMIALIGLIIVKAPHAPLLAFIVGITNMIPYFGPLVGEIMGAAVSFFVSPIKALIVFILLLCIQQFDAWYLDPKLIGKKVGVSPLGIIFAVTIGGAYFGPIGMLLAAPTMATFKIYFDKIVNKFKNDNKELIKRKNLS